MYTWMAEVVSLSSLSPEASPAPLISHCPITTYYSIYHPRFPKPPATRAAGARAPSGVESGTIKRGGGKGSSAKNGEILLLAGNSRHARPICPSREKGGGGRSCARIGGDLAEINACPGGRKSLERYVTQLPRGGGWSNELRWHFFLFCFPFLPERFPKTQIAPFRRGRLGDGVHEDSWDSREVIGSRLGTHSPFSL